MTQVIDCQECGVQSIAKLHTFQTKTLGLFKKVDYKKLNQKENKSEFLVDCYQQDKTHFICAKCYEKTNKVEVEADNNQIKLSRTIPLTLKNLRIISPIF